MSQIGTFLVSIFGSPLPYLTFVLETTRRMITLYCFICIAVSNEQTENFPDTICNVLMTRMFCRIHYKFRFYR